MRLDLLSQLESCSNRSWLWHYSKTNSSQKIDSSSLLYRLAVTKLEQILSRKDGVSGEYKIVIAETDPIEFLAAFLAGVITETNIFLGNPDWQLQEWQQVFKLVQPDLVFGKLQKQLTIKNQNISNKKIDGDQSLIMIPTGGSSGKIKFAMHTWLTLAASAKGFQDYFNCQKINSFCTLPLYHVSGLMQFVRSFLTQGNIVICPDKILQTKQINFKPENYFISLVPTQLQLLIETIPDLLAKFKTVLLGGAPARRSLLNEARRYDIPLAPTYGMTETASQIVTLKPQEFLANNNSSGLVLPHAKIKINSQNSLDSDNNIGLINIRCNSLCLGYYPHKFIQSQFTTDDLGYLDNEGYLYLVGRNSQKIITGGDRKSVV